ncbi:Lysophospholipase, alpha-beta hydrolase superfamily [Ectopseudomonas composti]|uniref:Lysophospholipase, alpha-beta hydrolase superfamily n=1 Tax=Ectopseudomonas composti TaxID=658457 RepID=A0A1I5PKH9_9GAMM|nr:alpha/beta hydrolase [Pseudomonas composti]SFP34652.1 Lysophospholipase, alpha-beta hydrolase superfamily [Pseudomonas composti]
MPRHALFIHGNWLTPTIWEPFQRRFCACGYSCTAPPWPPAQGSRQPGIAAILAHYEAHIRSLDQPPLLIGHDLGGLLVQMLLDRGLGQAGIALDPLPPRAGLLGLYSTWRWLLPWIGWRDLLHMTPHYFARNMAQTLTPTQQNIAYARHIVPAPWRVFVETALGIANAVDFANGERAPLLLLAGGNARAVRASVVAALYRSHRRSSAITRFKQFPGYSHWLIAEPGWERIADYSIEWAQNHVGRF